MPLQKSDKIFVAGPRGLVDSAAAFLKNEP
jgi:hypothetical protein